MGRWQRSVIRTRMPAWWFKVGAWYYHQHTLRILRKLRRLYD